jgi:hypothetical protein
LQEVTKLDSGKQLQRDVIQYQREEWTVPVLTGIRREPAVLTVAVAGTDIVIVPPPGEGYIVPPESLPRYLDALQAAKAVADHRRRGYRSERS